MTGFLDAPLCETLGVDKGVPILNSLMLDGGLSQFLSRAGQAGTSNRIGTIDVWVKPVPGKQLVLWYCGNSGAPDTDTFLRIASTGEINLQVWLSTSQITNIASSAVFRDPTAHINVRLDYDTTQAVAADRFKLFVNGEQITAFTTNTRQGQNTDVINSLYPQYIGKLSYAPLYSDGYISRMIRTDGTIAPALGRLSVDTGQWINSHLTPTYGINGFKLEFLNGSSLGTDTSGNGNNFTLNGGITSANQYTDTPTNNFAVLNPLDNIYGGVLSKGNTRIYVGTPSHLGNRSSIPLPANGLTYFETTIDVSTYGSAACGVGLAQNTVGLNSVPFFTGSGFTNAFGIYSVTICNMHLGSSDIGGLATLTAGEVVQIAYNGITGNGWIGRNDVWYNSSGGTNGNPSTGANPTFTTSLPNLFAQFDDYYAAQMTVNFGQRPWVKTCPTGFSGLSTANLPTPAIPNPNLHHYVKTLTKAGDTLFALPWDATAYDTLFEIKRRNGATDWYMVDGLRGYDNILNSNLTSSETPDANVIGVSGKIVTLKSSLSDGVYIVRAWKAGLAASRQTNTNGTITTTVSANQTAGFSIVTYTGNGTAGASAGHGLLSAPEFIIEKDRSAGTYNWSIQGGGKLWTPATSGLFLNTNTLNPSQITNGVTTSTLFYPANPAYSNVNTNLNVAYCFHSVIGYSKFGSFQGNANADGPYSYLGFTPWSMLLKNVNASSDWQMRDIERNTYNADINPLWTNLTNLEAPDVAHSIDELAGSFKIRASSAWINGNTNTIIYAAFARHPFGGSNVAPSPGR